LLVFRQKGRDLKEWGRLSRKRTGAKKKRKKRAATTRKMLGNSEEKKNRGEPGGEDLEGRLQPPASKKKGHLVAPGVEGFFKKRGAEASSRKKKFEPRDPKLLDCGGARDGLGRERRKTEPPGHKNSARESLNASRGKEALENVQCKGSTTGRLKRGD